MNPSRSPVSPPTVRPSTGSVRSPPDAACPHPATVSLPVIPVRSRSGQRRDGERERSPQLVESKPRRGEEGERLTRACGGGPGRKRDRSRGPESGNGAALRHSDTRAHVKWRVRTSARGSSLLRAHGYIIIRGPLSRSFAPRDDSRLRVRTSRLDRGASRIARIQCSRETTQERRSPSIVVVPVDARIEAASTLRDTPVARRARSSLCPIAIKPGSPCCGRGAESSGLSRHSWSRRGIL